MNRILFNLASILSALLLLAVVALWVRTYWVSDHVSHRSMDRDDAARADGDGRGPHFVRATDVVIWTGSGNVQITASVHGWDASDDLRRSSPTPAGWRWSRGEVKDPASLGIRTLWNRLGFVFDGARANGLYQLGWTTVCLPLWLPAVLLSVLPAWRARRMLRHHDDACRCRRCGYDLRATPGRCPECGLTC